MLRLSWVLALVVAATACKKEGAPAQQAGERPAARSEEGGSVTEEAGPVPLTPEKLEAYVGYQRRMLEVYATEYKAMKALDARILQEGSSEAARVKLKVIEAKAQAEEEARRAVGLGMEDVNAIAEVVTAVISQRELARQLGFDEELRRLEALQARLPADKQQELAPQVAEMRQRAQDFEGLAELRRRHGDASVDAVLAREQELTGAYQAMLQVFSGGEARGTSARKQP